MKNILCFGDSNTFGCNPSKLVRYNKHERWSGILKEKLKNKFNVIEAGCNNRTCYCDNPQGLEETGYKILPKYLTSEINHIIVQLGINDLQFSYNQNLDEFKTGFENFLISCKNNNENINIILLCPSIITNNILNSFFNQFFDKNSIEKSKHLEQIYQNLSDKFNCKLINLNKIAIVSDIDGLHYNIENHKKIADYLENYFIHLDF